MADNTITLRSADFLEVQPGTQLAVSDYWKAVDGYWLKLEHPIGSPGGAFRILGLFRRGSDLYLVVRSLNSFVPEVSEPFIVIRVIDRNFVSTLNAGEIAEVCPGDEAIASAQWTNLLGEFPDRTSVDPRLVESLSKSMTSELWLGNDVAVPFSKISIRQRSQGQGQVYFMLAAEGAETAYAFSLQWVGCFQQTNYCLVNYPALLTAEDPVVPRILLKVIDKGTLGVLSDPLDVSFARDAAAAVIAKGRVFAPQCESVFGFIPADP